MVTDSMSAWEDGGSALKMRWEGGRRGPEGMVARLSFVEEDNKGVAAAEEAEEAEDDDDVDDDDVDVSAESDDE